MANIPITIEDKIAGHIVETPDGPNKYDFVPSKDELFTPIKYKNIKKIKKDIKLFHDRFKKKYKCEDVQKWLEKAANGIEVNAFLLDSPAEKYYKLSQAKFASLILHPIWMIYSLDYGPKPKDIPEIASKHLTKLAHNFDDPKAHDPITREYYQLQYKAALDVWQSMYIEFKEFI